MIYRQNGEDCLTNNFDFSFLLIISKMPVSPNNKKKIADKFLNFENLSYNYPYNIENLLRKRLKSLYSFDLKKELEACKKELNYMQAYHVKYLSIYSEDYPDCLKNMYDPPFMLFFRGEIIDFGKKIVSVVGTRSFSSNGQRAAIELGKECAKKDIQLVSGFAKGIDILSQRGCYLEGGQTWGVLGTTYDNLYPSLHKNDYIKISKRGGGIISEYSLNVKTYSYDFIKRNRIIANICDALIVVESPLGGGSLHTLDFAAGVKDVYIHKVGLEMDGTKKAAEDGAQVIESIDEIF